MAEFDQNRRFVNPGGLQNPTEGPTITAANTIAPTHRKHVLTGTTVIKTITLPFSDFDGTVTFYGTGINTWDATGNISVAGTITTAASAISFTYFRSLGKWVPHRLA